MAHVKNKFDLHQKVFFIQFRCGQISIEVMKIDRIRFIKRWGDTMYTGDVYSCYASESTKYISDDSETQELVENQIFATFEEAKNKLLSDINSLEEVPTK